MATVLAYLALKLAAYTAWCLLALRRLRGPAAGELAAAAGYAAARILLGLGLGAALVMALRAVAPAGNPLGLSVPVYVLALALLRVFEWLAVGGLLLARAPRPAPGVGPRAAWVAGGVGLSFATDVVATALGVGLEGVPC